MKNNECCEVVIVGAAHTDLQLYPVGADVLDTASYSVKQMVLTVGGDALNEATVITRLGHKVRLVSCVGDDVIGSLVLEHCRKNNIGTEYIKVDSSKVKVKSSDKIVTLSTCTGDEETRFGVQGKLVRTYASR